MKLKNAFSPKESKLENRRKMRKQRRNDKAQSLQPTPQPRGR